MVHRGPSSHPEFVRKVSSPHHSVPTTARPAKGSASARFPDGDAERALRGGARLLRQLPDVLLLNTNKDIDFSNLRTSPTLLPTIYRPHALTQIRTSPIIRSSSWVWASDAQHTDQQTYIREKGGWRKVTDEKASKKTSM